MTSSAGQFWIFIDKLTQVQEQAIFRGDFIGFSSGSHNASAVDTHPAAKSGKEKRLFCSRLPQRYSRLYGYSRARIP